MKDSIKFAVLVRSLRNAFNLSQGALASRAGCSRPTVNRLESLGESSSRSDTVDNVLESFRTLGVQIRIFDDCLEICFTKDALENAERHINGDTGETALPGN